MVKVSPELRPDRCKVVFEKISSKVIYGTVDEQVEKLKSIVKKQISSFIEEGFSVVLRRVGKPNALVYIAPSHTSEEVLEDVNRFSGAQKLVVSKNKF